MHLWFLRGLINQQIKLEYYVILELGIICELNFPSSIAQCLNNNMMNYLKTAEKQRGLSITEFTKLASLFRPIRVILMDKRRHLIGREDHLDQLWVPHYLGRRPFWKSRPNSLVACLYTTRKFPDNIN